MLAGAIIGRFMIGAVVFELPLRWIAGCLEFVLYPKNSLKDS